MRTITTKLGNEIQKLLQILDLSDTVHEGIVLYAEKEDRQALTFLDSAVRAVENVVKNLDEGAGKKIQEPTRKLLEKRNLSSGGVLLFFRQVRLGGMPSFRRQSVCCTKG